ncbi:transporter substrate-binding domain-containing protein [Echinimonas agarilytica]|uniref:Transporter substrate-binding domain-containing protein n=1 Tax=Echinimonas agarilytica TaxID=1215918 RepID=A0AA41W3U1_9GAMM|nr:transporter substrate-binding domain-containing protein [Echinimonas agarilytica]MCM2678300.1 transporter substrate-binding domain-containing protein [Echinimonas agarilytica]
MGHTSGIKSLLHTLFIGLFAMVSAVTSVCAQDQQPPPKAFVTDKTVVIATRHAPPFSIKTDDGWQGISIELVRRVAANTDLKFEFKEMSIEEMLTATAQGDIQAAAAALTITAERERTVDFTHPYLSSGIGIAVVKSEDVGILDATKRFISPAFLKAVSALLFVLAVIGVLVWLAERRHNEEFNEAPVRGIAAGLWWSAVTMTTVGYGDKSPRTMGGRVVALVWMFASIIIISSFTAAIATSLTVNQLGQSIKGLDDLYDKKVMTLAQSTSADLLHDQLIRYSTADTVEDALQALADGEVSAVVYDIPILQYAVGNEFSEQLRVLPTVLARQDYGIALPPSTVAREVINQEILTVIDEPEWNNMMDVYLGRAK